MSFIQDLMDPTLLEEMVSQGYIRQQVHPNYPNLLIFNYAEKAVYERLWNEATLQCRGLIIDSDSGCVVARPLPKFFNLSEHIKEGALDFTPTPDFQVFEKVDGSLGILYQTPDGELAVATRGSFASEQALVGTEILRNKYPEFKPCEDCTYVFEIVYSSNRIVVDYGDREDLVLLDVIDKDSGESYLNDPDHVDDWIDFGGTIAESFFFDTLDDVVKAPSVKNAEGFVIRFTDGRRVKVKFDEYVRLHAIVTNTSSRTVWEALSRGEDLSNLFENVPDEFRDWVGNMAMTLESEHARVLDYVNDEYWAVRDALEDRFGVDEWTRRDFAQFVARNPYRALLFMRLDGRPLSEAVWKLIRPERTLPFKETA